MRSIARHLKTIIPAMFILTFLLGCIANAPKKLPNPEPPLDNLQAQLLNLPEELSLDIVSRTGEGNEFILAEYWAYMPQAGTDDGLGRLLSVYCLSPEGFDAVCDHSSWNCFARGQDVYYAITTATDLLEIEAYHNVLGTLQDYVMKTVLDTEGVMLYVQDLQTSVDRLMRAPYVNLALTVGGQTYSYSAVPNQDAYASYLANIPKDFQWEDAPYSTSEGAASLRISSDDGVASLLFSEGSYLVLDGAENCYKGQYVYAENDMTPFEYIRRLWFDLVELDSLRVAVSAISDQGQNHEEIALKWAEAYEKTLTEVAPGSSYACTSMEIIDMATDLPDWSEGEEFNFFAQSHGLDREAFGKDWFGFSYKTVFVPVDQSSASPFWMGNTSRYEGDDAPEGALTYSRFGIMLRTSDGWTCNVVGTGW